MLGPDIVYRKIYASGFDEQKVMKTHSFTATTRIYGNSTGTNGTVHRLSLEVRNMWGFFFQSQVVIRTLHFCNVMCEILPPNTTLESVIQCKSFIVGIF